MTTRFTEGPWKWYWRTNEEGHADCGVFWEKREGMAYSVCRAPKYQKEEQWEADARLIAAAPEMYLLLQRAAGTVKAGTLLGIAIENVLKKVQGDIP